METFQGLRYHSYHVPCYHVTLYQIDFSCTSPSFSVPAAGLFSCSRPRGTQTVHVYNRRKFGPRPRSVARSLGVQSRENWRVTTGSVSDDLEPTTPIETRNNFRIFKEHRQIGSMCSTPGHHHHDQQESEPLAAFGAVVLRASSMVQYHHQHHHQLQTLRIALSSHCTANISHKLERRNGWFLFGKEHAKPHLPLIFQISNAPQQQHPTAQQYSNSCTTQQQQLFTLLPCDGYYGVLYLCSNRTPQLAGGDSIRVLQQYVHPGRKRQSQEAISALLFERFNFSFSFWLS